MLYQALTGPGFSEEGGSGGCHLSTFSYLRCYILHRGERAAPQILSCPSRKPGRHSALPSPDPAQGVTVDVEVVVVEVDVVVVEVDVVVIVVVVIVVVAVVVLVVSAFRVSKRHTNRMKRENVCWLKL